MLVSSALERPSPGVASWAGCGGMVRLHRRISGYACFAPRARLGLPTPKPLLLDTGRSSGDDLSRRRVLPSPRWRGLDCLSNPSHGPMQGKTMGERPSQFLAIHSFMHPRMKP